MFLRRLFEAFFGDNSSAKPAKSPNTTTGQHKRDRIPKNVRDSVWTMYHGNNTTGICYSCGKTVERFNSGWHCSHILADVRGGKEILENLRVCCPKCNLSMGDQNLYAYIRDKNMSGPGSRNVNSYFRRHPSQVHSKRSNNWNKSKGS